jgi:hypothetical protein
MSYLRRLTQLQLHTAPPTFSRTAPRLSAQLHTSRPLLQSAFDMAQERPTGLKASSGIELLTWGTPNGWKASIILEELKEAYGKVGHNSVLAGTLR